MSKLDIGLDWYRDDAGYEIVPGPEPRGPGRALEIARKDRGASAEMARSLGRKLGADTRIIAYLVALQGEYWNPGREWMPSPLIRRVGGTLSQYRPLDTFPLLFSYFASIPKTQEGVLDFVRKYGPLTKKDGFSARWGENIEYLLDAARTMEAILELPKELALEFPIAIVKAKLVFDLSGTFRLKLDADELLNALWLQCALHLSGGVNLRRCRQCGIWFETGPGTRRRLDATFCSDEHRIVFNSRRRGRG